MFRTVAKCLHWSVIWSYFINMKVGLFKHFEDKGKNEPKNEESVSNLWWQNVAKFLLNFPHGFCWFYSNYQQMNQQQLQLCLPVCRYFLPVCRYFLPQKVTFFCHAWCYHQAKKWKLFPFRDLDNQRQIKLFMLWWQMRTIPFKVFQLGCNLEMYNNWCIKNQVVMAASCHFCTLWCNFQNIFSKVCLEVGGSP